MARQTITIDSQADWNTGEFSGTNSLDPAGSIILGVDSTRIADYVDKGGLAVYCRCYEGAGSTAANVGIAGDATLTSHAWVERDDGRSWLSGGTATVAEHASMYISDDNSKKYRQSGGIRIKLSSIAAQVLMTRGYVFILGINSDGKPYITARFGADVTKTAADALEVDREYTISFTLNNNTMMLYVDGVLKLSYTGTRQIQASEGFDLTVGCAGYWTDFYFFGDGDRGTAIEAQATGGYWKKTIDLGEVMKLQHLYVNCAKIEEEHSISARVSFGSTEDEISFEQSDNSILWTIEDGESWNEPPATKLKYGQYVEIKVQLGTMDWTRDLPLVYEFEAEFMPLSAGLLSSLDEDDEDVYSELQSDLQANTIPEDLESALIAIRELQAIVDEDRRPNSSSAGSGGMSISAIRAAVARNADYAAEMSGQISDLSAAFGEFSPTQLGTANFLSGLSEGRARDLMVGMILNNESAIDANGILITGHIAEVYADDVHNLLTDAPWSGDIATHAALTTGVHGAGAGAYICYAKQYPYEAESWIEGLRADLTWHVQAPGGILGGPIAHFLDADDIAAIGTIPDLATTTEVATAVSDHAALTTAASPGVHGAVTGVDIALTSDIPTDFDPAGTAATLVGNHSDLATGIHNCTLGYSLADTKDIVDHIVNASDPHNAAGYLVSSDLSGYATSAELSTHEGKSLNIHDVGAGNYIAKSDQSAKTVDVLVSDHAGGDNAHHEVVEPSDISGFKTEAEIATQITAYGYATETWIGTNYFTKTQAGNLWATITHYHDDRYYTETEADDRFEPKA